jgi:hypothetical protein
MNNKQIINKAPNNTTISFFVPQNSTPEATSALKALVVSTKPRSLADIRRIIELEDLLKLIKKDLLMRADEDDDGTKVVDISSSIWIKLNSILEQNS